MPSALLDLTVTFDLHRINMPTVLTPQGWVKVAPAPRRKQPPQNPASFLRGPLAYLACQPQPPQVSVGAGGKGKAPFPYDLSASPEKLKRQSNTKPNRTVSAPVMHGALYHSDEDDQASDPDIKMPRSPRSKPRSKVRRHHNDDNHSEASSSSSTSSHSGSPTSRSYNRHRPVETRPRPQTVTPSNHYYSAPRYDHYAAPPQQMPMPPTSGRSMSYNWYNATTPLNLN